jgi:hypothetical protein
MEMVADPALDNERFPPSESVEECEIDMPPGPTLMLAAAVPPLFADSSIPMPLAVARALAAAPPVRLDPPVAEALASAVPVALVADAVAIAPPGKSPFPPVAVEVAVALPELAIAVESAVPWPPVPPHPSAVRPPAAIDVAVAVPVPLVSASDEAFPDPPLPESDCPGSSYHEEVGSFAVAFATTFVAELLFDTTLVEAEPFPPLALLRPKPPFPIVEAVKVDSPSFAKRFRLALPLLPGAM